MKLPRHLTLKQRSDFHAIRQNGQSLPGRFVVMACREVPDLAHWCYAIITTKKSGKAHDRNRIRRLVRAVLVEEGHQLAAGHHYVFIARWQAKEATLAEIRKDILRAAKKLGVIAETDCAIEGTAL